MRCQMESGILKRSLRMIGKRFMKLHQPGVLTGAVLLGLAAMGAGNAAPPAVVRVDSGQLQGVVDDGVVSYKGIPLRQPPWASCGGVHLSRRRRGPAYATQRNSARTACRDGSALPRRLAGFRAGAVGRLSVPQRLASRERLAGNEATRDGLDLWGRVHCGSSSMPITSGTQFAKQGVIMVAVNYRVGRFGFFAFPALSRERPEEPKGNYAYMDQLAALQWVKRNIAAFGGDPNNVTIFGFSAGGVSVHSLVASPMARGLFHKAIVESGGSRDSVLTARPMSTDGVDPNYPVSAETIGINFARSMGIEGTDQAALTKLRTLSAEQVLHGAPAQPGANSPNYETTPILDGKLVTETAETAYKAGRATCSNHARKQQRRYCGQPDKGDHQGATVRPVREVERPGEGRLRS